MKTVIDSQTVNERMNELRVNSQVLSKYAKAVYEIVCADVDFYQLERIVQKKRARDYFGTTEAAHHVLMEVGEKKGKRLTI